MFDCFKKERKSPKEDAPEIKQMERFKSEYFPELPSMKERGSYPNNKPEGIIIHFTAGRQDANAIDTIKYGTKQGHLYAVLDYHGVMYEQFDRTKWGYHAGKSLCPVTNRSSVSKYYVGVEVQCAGLLEKKDDGYYTWFGKKISPIDYREVTTNQGYTSNGVFQKFTHKQESTLIDYCVSMCKEHGISPDLILSHAEVSPGRKTDCGGSLSMTMDEFRDKIRSLV